MDFAEQFHFSYTDDEFVILSNLISQSAHNIINSMASRCSFEAQNLALDPYPFQQVGIETGINAKRILIADEMGLGKTIQFIGIMAHLELYPTVVVCPAVLKLNIQREILKWVKGIKKEDVVILQGRKVVDPGKAKVYIINYDVLQDWVSFLIKLRPRMVVLDEIHYAKSGESRRGKAAKKLSKNIEYVIGLSGTPILNRPSELINILQILNRLDDVGGWQYYIYRYCGAHRTHFGLDITGASNLKELNTLLRSSGMYVRRRKSDVLKELPGKLPPQIIPLDLSNQREYDRAEADLAKWLAEKAIEDKEFLLSIRHLSPLQQIIETRKRKTSAEMQARGREELLRWGALKKLCSEGKVSGVKAWIDNFLEKEEKLVVFAWFQDTQQALATAWKNSVHALGVDDKDVRQEAIDSFNTNDTIKLFIASIKAVGFGVNLTAASHVCFADMGWTPGEHDQAEDRLDRIGQTLPVNVYYFIAAHTIEEEIIDVIDRKRKVVAGAIDGLDASTPEKFQDILVSRLLRKHKLITNE